MKSRMIIFSILITLLVSCGYKKIEIEKQSGRVNKVRKGDKFCISLPEDHNTKYLWTLKKDIPVNKVDYMGSVFHGTYTDFNFIAVGKGQEELTLYLYSARDTSAIKTFLVEVE
ncbi:MAG TPA: protease inhibitor I42 family protein [Bacteroidia bacterium]|jgi:predicted secreted protein|nr:protease inhibitor I42 family protein [Bacteroidia bacterium]